MSEVVDFADLMDEAERERWRVTDDRSADWAVRKIKQARAETEKWKTYYEEQLKKIEDENARTEEFFASCLAEYFESVPHHSTKTQDKYKLPNGQLIMKRRDPAYTVSDQVAATKWLEENGLIDYVEVKKSVRWNDLKKVVETVGDSVCDVDGEKIPGITVTPRDPEFVIK